MIMSNKTIALVAAVLVLTVGFLTYFAARTSGIVAGAMQSGTDITTTNYTTASFTNGYSVGGIFMTALRNPSLTQATTTVCAIQSPNATTTVQDASLFLTVSSTTASTVTIASASTPYATTTYLGSFAVAANAQAALLAAATSSMNFVLGPSQYVVFGMAGGTGTFSPAGVCEAVFQVIQ